MTEPQKHSNKPPRDRAGMLFGIRPVEWLTAALIGIGSGTATAVKTIRDRFHGDVRRSTLVAPVLEQHKEVLGEMAPNPGENGRSFRLRIAAQKVEHAKEYDALVQKHWLIEDGFLNGVTQRWESLSGRSKTNIRMNFVLGSIIGAAMTVSFFNGLATRDEIDKIEDHINAAKS